MIIEEERDYHDIIESGVEFAALMRKLVLYDPTAIEEVGNLSNKGYLTIRDKIDLAKFEAFRTQTFKSDEE